MAKLYLGNREITPSIYTIGSGSGEKYGANINTFLGNIDSNGILQNPTEQSDLVFTGVKGISDADLFYQKFSSLNIKSVTFPDLKSLKQTLKYMFIKCTNLTSVSFPSLEDITDNGGLQNTFSNCTNLTSVSFPNLTTINSVSTGTGYGLNYAFSGCTSLETISFPSLETLEGRYGLNYAFNGCTSLKTVYFPNLNSLNKNVVASGLNNAFRGCVALTDVYFNSLNTTSFNNEMNYYWQFTDMLSNTGTSVTHTLHFPSNLESTISTVAGYPLFGGTSGYVVLAYDLPATS